MGNDDAALASKNRRARRKQAKRAEDWENLPQDEYKAKQLDAGLSPMTQEKNPALKASEKFESGYLEIRNTVVCIGAKLQTDQATTTEKANKIQMRTAVSNTYRYLISADTRFSGQLNLLATRSFHHRNSVKEINPKTTEAVR
ncbi:hypothetical protein ACLMJK_000130 [Lecanora helva]